MNAETLSVCPFEVHADGLDAHAEASLIRQMHELVHDCFSLRPAVYWTDMLVSLAVAYLCAAIYLLTPQLSAWHLLAYFVVGFALFRVGTFIHEIQHFGKDKLVSFKVVWNIVCGIPLLMPSYMYDNHVDHHSIRRYGTNQDGEYLPLGSGPVHQIVLYMLQVPALPFLALLRFGVLTPFSLLHVGLRQWVLERASSYGINPSYRREIPPSAPRRLWALVDLTCFLWVLTLLSLLVSGRLPWIFFSRLYLLAVFTVGLNWTRNLAAHRYRSYGGRLSHLDQLADSVTMMDIHS